MSPILNRRSQFPAMTTTCRIQISILFALLAGVFLPGQAGAQVVVYKMSLSERAGFNFEFYDGGYFVAPLNGGSGSFIFTGRINRRLVYNATGSGTLEIGLSDGRQAKWIVRANSGANAAYAAQGNVFRWTRFTGPTYDLRTKIAPYLAGAALASNQETPAVGQNTDIGFAATFDFKLAWDQDQTSLACRRGEGVADTITRLGNELRRRGHRNENAPAAQPGGGTTTNPGIGTGTGIGIGISQ
jgi:hypothetical protein